jgi:AP-1 complex subunit beta-1
MSSISALKKRALHFFSGGKRGEIPEIREDLRSSSSSVRKHALRQTIASMTVGKDMSPLFTDIVNCGQTNNLQMKKLVYLYIMYYAKAQPDLAILAVNTFVKDAQDSNPLIRALAIRTMSCIRLERVVEYLAPPLRLALSDTDPYVRKTATLAVAKLFDLSPSMAVDGGFLEQLRKLLHDGNAVVMSNAVAAWLDIRRRVDLNNNIRIEWSLDATHIRRLLVALNECNEWGQLTLLEALALYEPQHGAEAKRIIERIAARLQHANCAVVLMTVRILWRLMDRFSSELATPGSSNSAYTELLSRKILPSLVTLVSSVNPPEVVYVALRVLHILVQSNATCLEKHFQNFFCDFSEPSYVKREKIDLLVYLISETNAASILAELQRYANDVDQNLAAQAVQAIGFAGLRCEAAAPAAVESLLSMARRGAPHLTQRVLIAAILLLRQYGRRFQAAAEKFVQIATVTDDERRQDALFRYEDEHARVALLWMIGEYAPVSCCTILAGSIWATEQDAGFLSETRLVQCQLLTTLARLYIRAVTGAPSSVEEASNALERVCKLAIEESGRPEVRHRAALYRTLLLQRSGDGAFQQLSLPELARSFQETATALPWNTLFEEHSALLCEFQEELGTIASLLGLSAQQLARPRPIRFQARAAASEEPPTTRDESRAPVQSTRPHSVSSQSRPVPTRQPAPIGPSLTPDSIPPRLLLTAEAGRGLRITGGLVRLHTPSSAPTMQLRLLLENIAAAQGVCDFAIQLNKNIFGAVAPAHFSTEPAMLQPGDSATVVIPLQTQASAFNEERANLLQIAIKCKPLGVLYFADTVPVSETLDATAETMDRATFLSQWNAIDPDAEVRLDRELPMHQSAVSIRSRVCALSHSMTIMAERWLAKDDENQAWQGYLACQMGRSAPLLVELVAQTPPGQLSLVMRSLASDVIQRRFADWLVSYLAQS